MAPATADSSFAPQAHDFRCVRRRPWSSPLRSQSSQASGAWQQVCPSGCQQQPRLTLLRATVRAAKFVARKQWVVCGADDMYIRVYNYNTMDKLKHFEAHTDYIRCLHAAGRATPSVHVLRADGWPVQESRRAPQPAAAAVVFRRHAYQALGPGTRWGACRARCCTAPPLPAGHVLSCRLAQGLELHADLRGALPLRHAGELPRPQHGARRWRAHAASGPAIWWRNWG